MQQFEVDMSKLEEQKKIAEYFRGFDHLITLYQRKRDALKKLKQYLLNNLEGIVKWKYETT